METEKDGNTETTRDLCQEHSGVCKDVLNTNNAVAAASANITRLFEKFEILAEKFQAKFEALSTDFQNKLVEFANRPGWVVCIVMTVMASIISIMGTFILYTYLK